MPIRLPSLPSTPDAGTPALQRASAPMPSVPGSAAMDTGSLTRGARSLLAERPIDSGSVNAGVLALQDLSQSVRQAAGVPADFAEKLLAAQNAADIARADTIMRESLAEQQSRMLTLPHEKWEETWVNEGLASAKERIAKLNLSPAAQAQLTPDLERWSLLSTSQIKNQAVRQKIEDFRSTTDASSEMAALDGDYELAYHLIDTGEKTGIYSKGEAEQRRVKVRKLVVAQAKERQSNQIVAAIESDPDSILPELEKAAAGEPTSLGEIDPIKAARFKNMALRESNTRKTELRNEVGNAIISGEIADRATFMERVEGKLDPKTIKSLERSLMREINFDPQKFSELRTRIALFDGKDDPTGKQADEILTAIETTVPLERQGLLRTEFSQVWSATVKDGKKREPKQEFTSALFKEIDAMTSRGTFGEYTTGKGDKAKVDDAKRLDAWNKAESIKDTMRTFLEKNPDATREDAINHFKGLLDPDIQASAKGALMKRISGQPSWWSGESYVDSISSPWTPPASDPPIDYTKTPEELAAIVDAALMLPEE